MSKKTIKHFQGGNTPGKSTVPKELTEAFLAGRLVGRRSRDYLYKLLIKLIDGKH